MAVEKTITFVEETELQQGYDTAEPKTVVNYWTEVDGRAVPGSFGTNETRAKAFYEKRQVINLFSILLQFIQKLISIPK